MARNRSRIIVADPDRFMRESMCMGLGDGFEIAQAASGTEVLDMFLSSPADAVLLDAAPGGIDGVEVCIRLRQMKGGAILPVYILGDDDDEKLPRRAFDAGATDFLLKPVHLGILARRIARDLSIASRVTGSASSSIEKSQAESEMFRSLPEPAVLAGSHGEVVMVNEAFERVFERRNSVVGDRVKDLLNGVDGDSFDRERIVYTDINCQGRGRVPVRVQHVALVNGPWQGCKVFFIVERSQSESASNAVLSVADRASIIVLEDYDVVARSIRRLLEKAGHRVSVAASADEAAAQFAEAIERKETFDLAILDVSIPGSAGGVEVLKTLRGMAPELPAIVTSGAWNEPAMSRPSEFGFAAALRKPFSRDELLEVTNRVLAKRRK